MSVSFMYPLCLRCGPRGSFWFSSGLPSERSPPLSTLSYFWPGISTLHVPKGEFLKVSYVTPYFILPHYYQPSWCSPSDGQGCGVSACVVLVVFLCFPVPFSFFFFLFFFIFLFFSSYIVTKDSRSTKLGISSPLVLPEGGRCVVLQWYYNVLVLLFLTDECGGVFISLHLCRRSRSQSRCHVTYSLSHNLFCHPLGFRRSLSTFQRFFIFFCSLSLYFSDLFLAKVVGISLLSAPVAPFFHSGSDPTPAVLFFFFFLDEQHKH